MRHANGGRRGRRAVTLSTVLALSVLGTAAAPQVAHAASPHCFVDDFDARSVDGDFNGDRTPDVPVGIPRSINGGASESGAVDVHLTDGSRQRLTLATVDNRNVGESGARFGAAVSAAEIDRDVCDELVIGSPGVGGRGSVYLLRGTRLGLGSSDVVTIDAPDGVAGDEFGASIATGFRDDGSTDLWVGAPGRTVSGQVAAGEVYHFVVSSTFQVTLAGRLSYATDGVAGAPAAGDRFGEVLAPAASGVTVGVPRRTVRGEARAGEVVFATLTGSTLTAEVVNQASPSVGGSPETGDRFGAAVSGTVVGVPGEDVGRLRDAGIVQVFPVAPARIARRTLTQDTAGVPGKAEEGDQFGAAVVVGTALLCQEQVDVAIGAPGESVGSAAGAGSVTLVDLQTDGGPCNATQVYTQRSLPGAVAAGNRLGAAVTRLSGNREDEEDYRSGLVVGVPGQDGGARNAGAVIRGVTNRTPTTLRAVGGDQGDQNYGSVLGTLPG